MDLTGDSLAFEWVRAATTLQGSVRDVPIDGVLRLLATSANSGLLVVNPANPLRLVLAEGSVVLGGTSSTMSIGRFALAAGMVSAEQLEELFGLVSSRLGERRSRNLDEIGVLETLADHVPAEQLSLAVRAQAVATVFEMLQFTDAEWHFAEAPPHPLASRFARTVDEILGAAAEQDRAWPELCERIGSDATRLRRVRRLAVAQTPVLLDAVDWAALSEVDEQSTVGQIAHRLGLGRPDAYAVPAGLMDRGVVERAA